MTQIYQNDQCILCKMIGGQHEMGCAFGLRPLSYQQLSITEKLNDPKFKREFRRSINEACDRWLFWLFKNERQYVGDIEDDKSRSNNIA